MTCNIRWSYERVLSDKYVGESVVRRETKGKRS